MATPRKENPQKAGAKTKYTSKYSEQAYKLCLLGATDPDLADFFEVAVSTISKWKLDFPEFSEALKRGKQMADANVSESLYKRATGYTHKAVKIFNDEGTPMVVPYEEHYPPDPTSMIFWLKNRQRHKWADKHEIQQTNVNYNTELSSKEIKELSKQLDKDV